VHTLHYAQRQFTHAFLKSVYNLQLSVQLHGIHVMVQNYHNIRLYWTNWQV